MIDIFSTPVSAYTNWKAASYPYHVIADTAAYDAFVWKLTDVPGGTIAGTFYCAWGTRTDGSKMLSLILGTSITSILYNSSNEYVQSYESTMSTDLLTDGDYTKIFTNEDKQKLDGLIVNPTAEMYAWSPDAGDWVNIGPISTAMTPDHADNTDIHLRAWERELWDAKSTVLLYDYDPAAAVYAVPGDIWINTITGQSFVCLSYMQGSSTWMPFGGTGEGGGEPPAPAGPVPIVGASTFNGYATGRVITHNIGHQDYDVRIMPTADPAGNLGEVWITKANSTVAIKCSGAALTAFEYVITPRA